MCNLNIFIKSVEQENDDYFNLISFLNNVTTNSFITNDDGDGVYFDYNNRLIKAKQKVNLIRYRNNIKNSNFILTHQRVSTSGFEKKFIQPFHNDEFVLLHNGVLRDFEQKNKSDTYVLFNQFYQCFKESVNHLEREKAIIESIKDLLNKIQGTFSIGLFDKITRNFYYFKNDYTTIKAFRSADKTQLYLTTKPNNEDFLEIYSNNFNEISITDFMIYRINIKNNMVKINPLSKLKKPIRSVWSTEKQTVTFESDLRGYDELKKECNSIPSNQNSISYSMLEDFKPSVNISAYCSECMERTNMHSEITNEFLCRQCINSYKKYENKRKLENQLT